MSLKLDMLRRKWALAMPINTKITIVFNLADRRWNKNQITVLKIQKKRLALASRFIKLVIYLRPSRRNAEDVKSTSFKSAEKSYILASLSRPIAI
jgi:hypothetical protein